MTNDVHFCEVCSTQSTVHPAPFGAIDRFFINPCCKGCGCGTYEEALANSSPEEKAYNADFEDKGGLAADRKELDKIVILDMIWVIV